MRKKIVWLMASVMLLSAMMLAGCGSKKEEVTAESLVKQANENMEKAKSYTGDMDMQMSMNMTQDDYSMDLDMGMTGTIEATIDPEIFHMTGTMNMSLLDISMDMDIYDENKDGEVTTYTGVADQWTKTVTAATESQSGMEDMYALASDGADMTLASETEKIGDKEVYVLTSTITGDKLQSLVASMGSVTEGMDIDLSTMEANVTMKIYKDTVLPASVSIEMKDNGEGMEAEGVIVKINSLNMVMNYNEFDKLDAITIPEEALAAEELDASALATDGTVTETEAGETTAETTAETASETTSES